jgi:D-glycero-alpha-D-manno-heptose-7-phosphate kinase
MIIRSKAPLRISFAGGGTDVPPFPALEGGCVLSATINKYAFGSLRPNDNSKINIRSLDYGLSISLDAAETVPYDGKLDLVKAAIRNFKGPQSSGFDLFLHTDVPPGSGLGSSSAMMVSLVGLLKEHRALPLTEYEIAHAAYVIEREDLGIKGGLQDHYAASFGGFNFIEFYKDRVIVNPLRVSTLTISELEYNLLLCFTGRTRSSDGIIDDQTSRYTRKSEETVDGLRQQKLLAVEMKNALLRNRLNEFGNLLHEAWIFKKKMSPKISNAYIDSLYEEARKHGAMGGKIMGAGGGGFMLFYCAFESKHKVADAVKKLGADPCEFGFTPSGLQTWRIAEEEGAPNTDQVR